jgi:hypothetical protein
MVTAEQIQQTLGAGGAAAMMQALQNVARLDTGAAPSGGAGVRRVSTSAGAAAALSGALPTEWMDGECAKYRQSLFCMYAWHRPWVAGKAGGW